ncbi:MAG TPA: FAD-dependent oxidoreductase [Myxococcota bacterium]|nr:FAD-dependent oxidoreductase [Myxococcota bacterium]
MRGPTTGSIWTATAPLRAFAPLVEDARADVCVIGAGIAGVSVAYALACEGRSVAVLDDGPLGGGNTAVTTAHLTTALDRRWELLERLHGERGAALAAASHAAAIDRIEQIVARENIACDFERLDGYLFLAPGDDPERLDRELAAAQRAGLSGVQLVPRAPHPSLDSGPCLRFPNQAQFHPLKYLLALASATATRGGRMFSGSRVDRIEIETPIVIHAGAHRVRADALVVATNAPINDRVAIHTKQAPYMTYAIAARVPRGTIARALYWDTADPFHYVRLHPLDPSPDGGPFDWLVGGGEDHKSGQANDAVERHGRLEAWARERFETLGAVEHRWSGQVMESIDGLAFIGRNPSDGDRVFVVTGDSGNGMTHGTIAGLLIPDLIAGRTNPWQPLYDPSRKPLRALGRYAHEAANMAAQYSDWLTAGEVASAAEIPHGGGAILRRGLAKLAAYRDEHGVLHVRSAVCPHLGCIVAWNAAAESWDCPCHGSRFDKLGTRINGPANADLAKASAPR